MTGERMETVREALAFLRSVIQSGETYTETCVLHESLALAEVERWEHDRARDKRIETAARHYLNGTDPDAYINLRAALGEGQDRDRPLVRCPVFGEARGTAGCEVCGGDIVNCPIYGPTERARLAKVGECPCDGGDRGCVCG